MKGTTWLATQCDVEPSWALFDIFGGSHVEKLQARCRHRNRHFRYSGISGGWRGLLRRICQQSSCCWGGTFDSIGTEYLFDNSSRQRRIRQKNDRKPPDIQITKDRALYFSTDNSVIGVREFYMSSSYHPNNTHHGDPELGAYYEYNHGSGQHVLMRGHGAAAKPQYSLQCLACHCVDGLILVAVLAFLGFSMYIAYYALNNFGG